MEKLIDKDYVLDNSQFIAEIRQCVNEIRDYPSKDAFKDLVYWCELGLITVEFNITYREGRKTTYGIVLEITSYNQNVTLEEANKLNLGMIMSILSSDGYILDFTVPKKLVKELQDYLIKNKIEFTTSAFEGESLDIDI